MSTISSEQLASQLKCDYPQLHFCRGTTAKWSADAQKITYANNIFDLLHETGHGILHHTTYYQDIDLLHQERAAWDMATTIGQKYGITIPSKYIEGALDSYRDWLHRRSCCPCCGQTGVQSQDTLRYHCLNCNTTWQTNDARCCALRRKKCPS